MKKERKSLIFSMFINLIVSILKIIGGLFLGSYALVTTGYHTLCNLVEELLAFIGGIIGHKRANQKHPFGFGKIEYIAQILVGIVFIFLSIFIFIKSLHLEYSQTNPIIIFVIISVALIQLLNANYLLQIGKDIHSQMLFSSSHNSYYDTILTLITTLFIILSIWISLFDFLGCLLIVILIAYKGFRIIFDNIILINGQNDNSPKIKKEITNIVNHTKDVTFSSLSLINIQNYYCITLEIGVDDAITIGKLIRIEFNLRNKIHRKLKIIKTIDFEILKK